MNYLYLILLAVAPGVALVFFILLNDRYDREPARLLFKVFFMGMLVTLPTIVVELIGQYFNIFNGIYGLLFEAFIVIGLSEEFFKRRVVLRYAFTIPHSTKSWTASYTAASPRSALPRWKTSFMCCRIIRWIRPYGSHVPS